MYSKLIFLCCMLSAKAAPHVYDQSQNGELNVQVDLKDLQIFALLSGKHEEYYEDIDYAYDYSEMTIKPQTGTSKKPANATTTDSSSDNVTVATTMAMEVTTEPPKNISLESSELTTLANETTTEKIETAIMTNISAETANISSQAANITSETANTTLIQQSRKEDWVAPTEKDASETSTKTTNLPNPVTQKPQPPMNHILPIKSEVQATTSSVNTAVTNVTTKPTASSNCKKGLVGNQRGGCDLKIQSMSNTLLKIVKLSQKLKSRRHRNGQDTI